MLTNFVTVNGHYFPRLRWQVATQEFTEFAFTDKTDTGGVFFFAVIRSSSSAILHFRFFQLTNREQALCDLLMAQCVQEVALIFVAIQTTQQLALPFTSARRT
jgi:hypothetical protein